MAPALFVGLFLVLSSCASSNTGSDGGPDLGGGPGAPDLRQSGPGRDLAGGGHPDMPLSAGSPCTANDQCASGACLPFGLGQAKQCAAPCKAQADCDKLFENTFCEPQAAGQTTGFCTPDSALHCSTCTKATDCGSLAETCLQAPGDIAPACHIDCSLSGASACPPDYTCASVMDNGTARMLCMPGTTKVCLDSLGGYCNRVSTPQSCARTNATGTCTGERVCMTNNQRYDVCGAAAPQYLPNCTAQNPAGCMLEVNPTVLTGDANNCGACGHACGAGQGCCSSTCTALNTTANCGACGNACPAVVNGTDAVSCANPAAKQCGMTCVGENYDVNNNIADGCEKLHSGSNHDLASAIGLPGSSCYGSTGSFTGTIDSDSRVHNPAPTNFSATVGSAPDWYNTYNTGGTFCCDTYSISIKTTGGGATACYQLSFITDKIPNGASVTVTGNGSASMSGPSSGAWNDDSNLQFVVQKICSLPTQESITYTVNYSLGNTLCI